MAFGPLASSIRTFIAWHDSSGDQVQEHDLKHLETLLQVLEQKIKDYAEFPEPAPLPPEAPTPPLMSGNSRESIAARKKYSTELMKYRMAMDRWRRQMAAWHARQDAAELKLKSVDSERRILENRRNELEGYFLRGGWPSIIELNWYILPPGFWPRSSVEVTRIFPRINRDKYRPERISNAFDIGPFEVGRGRGDFDQYLCFRYKFTSRVLLESADEGNAAYLLIGDWQKLSRLTKHDLITGHQSEHVRIVHRQDSHWRADILNALQHG